MLKVCRGGMRTTMALWRWTCFYMRVQDQWCAKGASVALEQDSWEILICGLMLLCKPDGCLDCGQHMAIQAYGQRPV